MLKPISEIIAEYLTAYEAANPGVSQPKLEYDDGWFRLFFANMGTSNRYRANQINEFTERLRDRALKRKTGRKK